MLEHASPTPEQIEIAAKYRAQGSSWEGIAKELGCHASTLRRWIRTVPEQWNAALRKAEEEFLHEMNAEALTTLRMQIRGKDEDDARDACAKVLTAFTARLRGKHGNTNENSGPANVTIDELEEFLMEVPRDILEAAFAERRRASRPREPDAGLPPAA